MAIYLSRSILRRLAPARGLVRRPAAAMAVRGARQLSYVPVDDIINGLTDDQIKVVRLCVIHSTCN